ALCLGRIGSFGHLGTVHPHEPCASLMIMGFLPTFLKTKSHSAGGPSITSPKSCVSSSNLNLPASGSGGTCCFGCRADAGRGIGGLAGCVGGGATCFFWPYTPAALSDRQ